MVSGATYPSLPQAIPDRASVGAYLVIFSECLRVLYSRYSRGTFVVYLWVVAIAIWILCTIVGGPFVFMRVP